MTEIFVLSEQQKRTTRQAYEPWLGERLQQFRGSNEFVQRLNNGCKPRSSRPVQLPAVQHQLVNRLGTVLNENASLNYR